VMPAAAAAAARGAAPRKVETWLVEVRVCSFDVHRAYL
jgi:hypothetical protein